FFDTVFYLLVPLARSMYGRTNRNYLKYLLAIAAGAGATHTLVPPTPGPLAIAGTLGVDLGTMVLVGIVVALPAARVGVRCARRGDAHAGPAHPRAAGDRRHVGSRPRNHGAGRHRRSPAGGRGRAAVRGLGGPPHARGAASPRRPRPRRGSGSAVTSWSRSLTP